MSKIDLILQGFLEKIADKNIKERYIKLYEEYWVTYATLFGYFHQELNNLFEFLNIKNDSNKHFNAEPSRELLFIIKSLDDLNMDLDVYWEEIIIADKYKKIIDIAREFLCSSGWSPIPEVFPRIHIVNYEPIFSTNSRKVVIQNTRQSLDLQVIGEWAFSLVSRYKDPTYNKYFAIKKLKKGSSEREIERFKKEFEILKKLNFPYILEVYCFDETQFSYTMEFCDTSLLKYISANNSKLPFASRKRIVLQFLYAINYLHHKKILHRDISYNNILIKQFEWAVIVKLSDFWLMKEVWSDFTKIDTDIKWTIIDPALTNFKDYDILNEIYSIGFIINFIFTGKKSFNSDDTDLSKVVEQCTTSNTKKRYQSVTHIISSIEGLNN